MSKFIPFTDEELYRAHHFQIKDYLESIGETVIKSGTEFMWAKHDSVKFRGHVWYQHSTGEKGTAVTFLQVFFGFSYQEAVSTLLNGQYRFSSKIRPENLPTDIPVVYHKKDKVLLPPKNENNNRLFAYLCKSRRISQEIVNYFVHKKLIYEDKDNHNIVFVGKDKKGVVRYAGLKGTLTYKPFKGEISNSNKNYCFKHIGRSDTLYVFEAFIDLFSYIDLFLLNTNWKEQNYIALGGLYTDPLKKLLSTYTHIQKIVFCTDNDVNSSDGINHGQVFAQKAQKALSDKYQCSIHIPELKDWNEILKKEKKQ